MGRPNLKAVLDLGHAHVLGFDVAEQVRILGTRLGHLHLYNNYGGACDHNQLKDGNIDLEAFCRALREVNYPGTMMFEVRQPAAPEELLESAEILRRFL